MHVNRVDLVAIYAIVSVFEDVSGGVFAYLGGVLRYL